MELYFPFLYSFIFVFLSISAIIITAKCSPRISSGLPPGTSGWPVAGENIEFILSGPQRFISNRVTKFSSEVFQTSLWGERMAVFCGPTGNKFLFLNENKFLTSWWPNSLRKALLFPSFTDKTVKEVGAWKRSILQEFIKPDALKAYIPLMDSMGREHLDKHWIPNNEVKVFPLSKKYTFDLACRIFMNLNDAKRVDRLAGLLGTVISGLFSVPIDLPGTTYNRTLKMGKKVREELLEIIRERRKDTLNEKVEGADQDLLSRLVLEAGEIDRYEREMEISNSTIGLLAASYDTTSIAITFTLKYLAEFPHVYNEVYKEQIEIAKSKSPGELLNWDDIQKMKYSWNVVCEALRLAPPVLGGFKEATSDFEYNGFTIPKGWKTFWSAHSTHTNPKYFPDPEKFDPSRFEESGPPPYAFVPFGGGPRMCPGKEYARMEILVFMHNVVTKFKLEKLSPKEKVVFHASPIPTEGVPVRLIKHQNK